MSMTYPEHEKLKKIQKQSQTIGTFLDWLQNERKPTLQLCQVDTEVEHYYPTHVGIQDLLSEYFKIDLVKLEKEKREILDEFRRRSK